MELNKKYSLLIAVTFYCSAFAQNIENQEVSVNKMALDSIIVQQKIASHHNKVVMERLKSQYKEFINDGINEKQLIGADEFGNPLYYTTLNVNASKRIKANSLYSGGGLGLNVSGQGMIIGQWDSSKPRTNHELITGKFTYGNDQNQTISRHSTHIMGTMVGNNYSDTNATGVAYSATAHAYDWVDDVQEMATEARQGLLVANNSYGFDPIYYQTYQFGKYNETARDWDQIMYNAPYFQIVKAAGNARAIDPAIVPQVSAKGGYDLLEGAGVAKNVLVVTSVDKNENPTGDSDFSVSSFSSFGGTDDGRIKPDIAAQGQDVYSSIETYNFAYGVYDGTSSATASVSAAIALLQEYWLFHDPSMFNGVSLKSSTIRALLAHTANDTGSLGPDYKTGYGLMNTERAVKLLANDSRNTLVKESTLQEGGEFRLYVVASKFEQQPLVATLAWTDPQGAIPNDLTDNHQKALINDLDITILKRGSTGSIQTFYPWKLGGMDYLTADATRGSDNSVDNLEKVEIDNPDGLYEIVINHKSNFLYNRFSHFLLLYPEFPIAIQMICMC